MYNLSGMIVAEGDTGIARFWCGQCGQNFRARIDSVVSKDGIPFCLRCVEAAQPLRKARGLEPIRVIPDAYLEG